MDFQINDDYLVSSFQGFVELLAHAVMLDGQECRVEDDADGDCGLEEGVVNHPEQKVLEPQPAPVAYAAAATSGAISVFRGFWKVKTNDLNKIVLSSKKLTIN